MGIFFVYSQQIIGDMKHFILILFAVLLLVSSVCSVGVVMVHDGQVADSFYSLIQPESNYYNYWCQRVHGISQCDTDDAPVFSKVWQQLEERIIDVFFSDMTATPDLRSTSDARGLKIYENLFNLLPHVI